MKGFSQAGFTIIETMLFLGITGLMIVGILVGTGSSINVQRYRDSVVSLQSMIQQQYSEVENVMNDRGSDVTCDDGTIVAGVGQRGSSNCVVLGRIIADSFNGFRVVTASVVGLMPPDITNYQSDESLLKDSKISIIPKSKEIHTLDWGTSIVPIGSTVNMASPHFIVLIIRSPISGNIKTFINNAATPNGWSKIPLDWVLNTQSVFFDISDLNKKDLKMCVEGQGLTAQKRMSIYLTADTTNASGVEILGDGDAANEC